VLPSEHVVAMLIIWQHYNAHGKEIADPTMITYHAKGFHMDALKASNFQHI